MPYRKPDQYYIDLYDRETIEELKAKEKEELEELAGVEDLQKRADISLRHSIAFHSFRNTGIFRARERRNFIQHMMAADERMDRLIEKTKVPKGVRCKTCDGVMKVCEHFFDVGDNPILFVFECEEGHFPRRVIYPDGREYFFPKHKCKKCGFEITEKVKKLKTKIVTTCSCAMCGETWTEDLDIRFKQPKESVISAEDRKKYCTAFDGMKTFMEDFEAFADLCLEVDEGAGLKRRMETSGAGKIEKVTIPELEARLVKVTEGAGFIKLQFEKPEMRQFVKVPFTIQDPSKRLEKESRKALSVAMETELKDVNWRLLGELTYRLGYLTGALKAFEEDGDLVKLAEERNKKKGKRKG